MNLNWKGIGRNAYTCTQYHVQRLYVSCVIFCLSVQQTKKSTFGGSSKHASPPALYPWLNRFKNLLLSKVSSSRMQFLSSENLLSLSLSLSKRFQLNVICTDHKFQSHFLLPFTGTDSIRTEWLNWDVLFI